MEETRADESLPWFKQRVRQPHNQLRLFVGYGLQLTLALVGGACLDLPNHECTHDPRHDTHDGRPTPSSGPPPFTGTADPAATPRQDRPSIRRALSLDSGASTCSECYYAYYLGDVHRTAFVEEDLERNFGSFHFY